MHFFGQINYRFDGLCMERARAIANKRKKKEKKNQQQNENLWGIRVDITSNAKPCTLRAIDRVNERSMQKEIRYFNQWYYDWDVVVAVAVITAYAFV